MIWDLIRDWFVIYIWGGYTSTGVSINTAHLGLFLRSANDTPSLNTGNLYIPFNVYDRSGVTTIAYSLGDWLSTTSTIITLIILVVVFFLFIRYLYRLTAGLLRVH